jgi:signal transduction histidine kinase
VALLARAEFGDYFSVLFGILSMQATLRLGWKTAVIWVVLFIPLTGLPLTLTYDVPQAIAFACMYATANGFLALFAFVTRRAVEARERNQALMDELQVANREIRAYSRQLERLAATKERHRLARELHDSVTQTVFGMNLTAQSAALLLQRDRSAASTQLGRLEELAQGALAEIGLLGSELAPAELGEGGLVLALRQHLAQRGLLGDDGATNETGATGDDGATDETGPPRGLRVTLSVECTEEPGGGGAGGGECAATAAHAQSALSPAEELCLFRIAQEALNNIVKHAQTGEAAIRLRLSPPCRLVIEDRGRGFIPEAAEGAWPADGGGPADGAQRAGGARRAGGTQPPDDARSAAGSPPEQGSGGMGLANMRERAAEIGWRLSIVSAPGQGTRITAEQSEKRAEG